MEARDLLEAQELALLEAEDYYCAKERLADYVKSAWPVLEPGKKYSHNWHIDLISEYLTAVHLGQIKRLLINMPPRHMKSINVTVCFPTWVWLHNPTRQFMFASYSERLSYKHSRDRRHLIRSPWYQKAWADRFRMADDDNQIQKFTNDRRGHMIATSVGGASTGEGFDIGIIDDPVNPKEAASEVLRVRANDWRDQTWSTRKNSKEAAEIIVMQRLHEKDQSGHVLAKGGWEHLVIPMEAEKRTIIVFPLSKRKVTRELGDILQPERFGPEEIERLKIDLGPVAYPAQYQQDPKPAGGGFIKRKWWKRYGDVPKDIMRIRQYWDCAEEPGVDNDFSTCATWAETPTGFYCLGVWRDKVAWPELEQAAKDQYAMWNSWSRGKLDKVKIEKKSAGTQLVQSLSKNTKIPVEIFEPGQRSKYVRASAAQPTIKAGNAYLPEAEYARESDAGPDLPCDRDWVEVFISEHEKFPFAEHDDQVDTTSMAIEDLRLGDDDTPEVF